MLPPEARVGGLESWRIGRPPAAGPVLDLLGEKNRSGKLFYFYHFNPFYIFLWTASGII